MCILYIVSVSMSVITAVRQHLQHLCSMDCAVFLNVLQMDSVLYQQMDSVLYQYVRGINSYRTGGYFPKYKSISICFHLSVQPHKPEVYTLGELFIMITMAVNKSLKTIYILV